MTTRNHRIRFMNSNYAELTSLTKIISSELSGYPFTNCLADTRTKYWRPSGCFTIDSTNNLIYINDGSNKTITLTAGIYATPALFATHIQTKLNAASSNWIVTYITTNNLYKFRIQHTGSAILRFSQTTSSTWNILGFTLLSDTTGTDWYAQEQRNHIEEYAIFDFGFRTQVGFVALIADCGTPFTVSRNATVTIYGSNINQFSTPAYTQVLTVTEKGIFGFLDNIDPMGYRYYKVSIIDKYNYLGPEGLLIGNLFLGPYTTISNRNVANGIQIQLVDPSEITRSESGVLYSDIKIKYFKCDNMSIGLLDRTDKDTLMSLWENLGKTKPFYISLDPTLAITDNLYDLTKYVVFQDTPTFTHVIRDIFSMSLSVMEVI
jgi:hypothetical protein